MRLMVRVLSWYVFVSQHLPYVRSIVEVYIALLAYDALLHYLPELIGYSPILWEAIQEVFEKLIVIQIVRDVCVIGTHYIIKSLKHRTALDYLMLSHQMVHSIHTLVNGRDMSLNKKQCLDLSSKLSQTMQNIHKLERQCGLSNSVFGPSLEHLYQVLLKAKLLVNDCSNENWIRTSVFQIQNESTFQVILMDVGFCYHAICEQAKLSMSGEWKNLDLEDLRDSSTFKPTSVTDVDEDQEELRKRLENLVDARNYGSGWLFRVYYFLLVRLSKKLRLAEYLVVKLHCIAQQTLSDGLHLSKRLLWEEESYPSMTWGREVPLGVGSGASGVCKTKWLSVPCAKKCNIPEPYFLKEAGILSHVNYPNIIKFICCGEKSNLVKDFIALELMEMSLSDLIKQKGKKRIPFSYAVAVDIMAQIGRGMCYLHGLSVAHRDLKPANVVLNVLTSPHLEDTYHVKLVDFGTSKTKVDPLRTTSTEHGFGTLTHKAPEVRHLAPAKSEGDRKWRAVWFKADVWSFAIICLEVLSLKLRKALDKEDEDLKSLILTDCPEALVALLEDCLLANPRARPDFLEVCSRLEALRHCLFRRLPSADQDPLSEYSLDCLQNQFIEMSLKEHFHRQNAGVVADDEEVEVLIPQASHIEQQANEETFRYRMDQAPNLTAREGRNLEIWTRQPGNEVFRKAVEEWREERKLIAGRLRMNKDQKVALEKQRKFTFRLHRLFIFSFFLAVSVFLYGKMHNWWVAYYFLVLLEASGYLWLVLYEHRSLWRLCKALRSDLNKRMVYKYRIFMLNQKRHFFSFEEDAKEYDPSSNSAPKPARELLDFVTKAFRGLLLSIILIVASFYFRPCGFTGRILTIISALITVLLFFLELRRVAYEFLKSNDLVIDTERGWTLQSNKPFITTRMQLDVTCPALTSSVVCSEAMDISGEQNLDWVSMNKNGGCCNATSPKNKVERFH